MKRNLLILTFCLSAAFSKAQSSTCLVMLDSLKGSYEGDCKSGKAEGHGKAIGTDTYEGNFKKGLPDGLGKYTWKNGNYYIGDWKNGLKDGHGEMFTIAGDKKDTLEGYWKKDVYKGLYKDPYVITNKSSEVGRVEVTKLHKAKENELGKVEVTVENLKSASSTFNSGFATTTIMTESRVTRGGYMGKVTTPLTNREVTTYQGVQFPVSFYFAFGNSILEVDIFEPGEWSINVPINK